MADIPLREDSIISLMVSFSKKKKILSFERNSMTQKNRARFSTNPCPNISGCRLSLHIYIERERVGAKEYQGNNVMCKEKRKMWWVMKELKLFSQLCFFTSEKKTPSSWRCSCLKEIKVSKAFAHMSFLLKMSGRITFNNSV